MIKQELISAVAERTLMSEYEVRKVIESAFDTIVETLNGGEEVIIRGFGSFNIVRRAEKSVRDINAGKQYTMPARNTVKFKPGNKIN